MDGRTQERSARRLRNLIWKEKMDTRRGPKLSHALRAARHDLTTAQAMRCHIFSVFRSQHPGIPRLYKPCDVYQSILTSAKLNYRASGLHKSIIAALNLCWKSPWFARYPCMYERLNSTICRISSPVYRRLES